MPPKPPLQRQRWPRVARELQKLCVNKSTLKGFIRGWGPGVVVGREETRPVYPEDFAPAAAHLLGIRPPAASEGRGLHRLLS